MKKLWEILTNENTLFTLIMIGLFLILTAIVFTSACSLAPQDDLIIYTGTECVQLKNIDEI